MDRSIQSDGERKIDCMEAPDEIDSEVFAEFKKENGWKYGW